MMEEFSEDFDYHQNIARSAFADMVHDSERNQKYYAALKLSIERLHAKGLKANVLDIGTGSGILSMMAVKCGADSVVACEAFVPMAECAEKIIQSNLMSEKIKLVKKASTDLTVGIGEDLDQRANILVTELLDTELIGEGAIATYKHAHEHLLEKGCIVIPDSATIYAQIVQCPTALSWHLPKSISNADGDLLLRTPPNIVDCAGSSAVHDIQLSQLLASNFLALSKPIPVFHFDWSGKEELKYERCSKDKVKIFNNGIAHVIFMWWDLKMDVEGTIMLSCAPYWSHPDFESLKTNKSVDCNKPEQNLIPWRDHWMQGVYYLSKCDKFYQQNEEITLISCHDEFSLWFGLTDVPPRPHCSCGFHIFNSRTRIGQMNDNLRNKKYLNFLEKHLNEKSVVLVLSEGSLLGLAAAVAVAGKFYVFEPENISKKCMLEFVEFNQIKNVEILSDLSEISNFNEITHVVGEPNFSSSILPWDNLYFGTLLQQIQNKLNKDVVIIPKSATISAVPVEFIDLHKICTPLRSCEGFDLSIMDQLIEESSNVSDTIVEAQPLWEYPGYALGDSVVLMSIDLTNFGACIETNGCFDVENAEKCNGIAVWINWHLDGSNSPKTTISTGPNLPILKNEIINWNMHCRQGVHLFKNFPNPQQSFKWNIKFSAQFGKLYFNFD